MLVEVMNKPGDPQVDLDANYPRLADILCEWCLLRHIILKQKIHCERYPADIKVIRSLYYNYLDPFYYGFTVERWVRFINHCLIKLIWYDKKASVRNIYDAIYVYGNEASDQIWFKRLQNKILEINHKLTESFVRHFDFEKGILSFSNIPLDPYCDAVIKEAQRMFPFNRKALINSPFFKSYLTDNYSMSLQLDSIEVKLNDRYYNKYVYSSVQDFYNRVYYAGHKQST